MRERGLTMIEVIVALMVFAVGICSAMSVGYVASHWGMKARQEMEASRLARALYDYARRVDPPSGDVLSSPGSGFDFVSPVQLVWRVEVGDAPSLGMRSLTITISSDTDGNGLFDDYVISTGGGDETVAVFNALLR